MKIYLKEVLELTETTYVELAEAIGRSKNYIADVVHDETVLRIDELEKIVNYLEDKSDYTKYQLLDMLFKNKTTSDLLDYVAVTIDCKEKEIIIDKLQEANQELRKTIEEYEVEFESLKGKNKFEVGELKESYSRLKRKYEKACYFIANKLFEDEE